MSNMAIIVVREWILRLSENFKAKSSTRWVLNLVAHLELRSLKDSLFFLCEMILIIDEGLFGRTEEVINICCGRVGYLNLVLLVLLSKKMSIIKSGISRVNLVLQERTIVDLIHTSQNRLMHIGYTSLWDRSFGEEFCSAVSQTLGMLLVLI